MPRLSVAEKSGDRPNPRKMRTPILLAAMTALALIPLTESCRPEIEAENRWRELGPVDPFAPSPSTLTGAPTTFSGRIASLAIDPNCGQPGSGCRLWVGAASGGVWRTEDAMADKVRWEIVSTGLTSSAIGAIVIDPNDPSGNTLYAGTGTQNRYGDSQAGVGLFRSTDSGDSWSLVPGSPAAAHGRGLGSIAIHPTDPKTIYIGTSVAFHGSTATLGGAEPPGAPPPGLYRSTDGGVTFKALFQHGSPSAGVNSIQLDPRDPSTIYVALFPAGIWRSSPRLDGDAAFRQVLAPPAGIKPVPSVDRTEFALTVKSGHTRIYAGNAYQESFPQIVPPSVLWRTDNADVPAHELFNGATNVGWTRLSDPTNGTPGFGSYQYCQTQCRFANFVAVDPQNPDTVWLGGGVQLGELLLDPQVVSPRSNGRIVMASYDAGVHFHDMTNDAATPPNGMHPDQHAIVFHPRNTAIAFIGSDGGLVRTSGELTDGTELCSERNLSGPDLADCKTWLSKIPTRIFSLNEGLATLQFYSVTVNPQNPSGDLIAGAQDNGLWAYGGSPLWFESTRGDSGQTAIDSADPAIRMTTAFGVNVLVNFHGADPTRWDTTSDPLQNSGERNSNFLPLIADPRVGGAFFTGLERVWRTRNSGGPREMLDRDCSISARPKKLIRTMGAEPEQEAARTENAVVCGDWAPIGPNLTDSSFGDRDGTFIVHLARAPGDVSTLWVGIYTGRVFISLNAEADPAAVEFTRIDEANTPGRFVSGIAVNPGDANHAWVSYTGYGVRTPATPGHVYETRFDPAGGTATWKDVSFNLEDRPLSDIVFDEKTGDLYVSSDWGVMRLAAGADQWRPADAGLPLVAVYDLTISPSSRLLHAATHGRGAWVLSLPDK